MWQIGDINCVKKVEKNNEWVNKVVMDSVLVFS